MALTVPNLHGEILMLQYIVGLANAGSPILRLYSSPDAAPTDSTVVGDLTQVTSAGYAAVTLVSSLWTVSQTGGVTTAAYSEVTFTFSTDAVVYGYYVTNGSGQLLWLERFSGAPFTIPSGGGTVSITSRLVLS